MEVSNTLAFDLQPHLENDLIRIQPLKKEDFQMLYEVASDPLLWEQHPNKDRYRKEVFQTFFQGALESGGAFLVYNNQTGVLIGSSRFYELNEGEKTICIGYTFISRDHWGKAFNKALKTLMLNHAFKFVNKVIFHIGAYNIRSQKAIQKLGAVKFGEQEMEYYGEQKKLNFYFQIEKNKWLEAQNSTS